MPNLWWVTVGVPGGEYASRDYGTISEMNKLPPHQVREAPPDLAEWLDCTMHELYSVDIYRSDDLSITMRRIKVEGGWFYLDERQINYPLTDGSEPMITGTDMRGFVPVPLSANITIKGESDNG